MRRWLTNTLLRFLLRLAWSRGGASDAADGLPRLRAADITPALPELLPGDFIVCGNNGGLSHIAVHTGQGMIVHSMATAHTMRGSLGALWDALRGLFVRDHTGVIEERLVDFFERYERDTWAVLRAPLSPDQRDAGLARVRALIGQPYDYDFDPNNDAYYCTELVLVFLDGAMGPDAPRFETRRVRVPGLIDTQVVEPIHVLRHPDLQAVVANDAAHAAFAEHLPSARLLPPK